MFNLEKYRKKMVDVDASRKEWLKLGEEGGRWGEGGRYK